MNTHRRLSAVYCPYRGYRCIALVCLLLVSSLSQAAEIPRPFRQDGEVLIVGVREVDKPFSYRSAKRSNSRILTGYGGYMIEICRRILGEMVSDGYFEGYRILTKPVTAGNRFSLLDTGQVDILCGPDSITQDRLERYTTSHPLFLSGVVLVSKPAKDFPQTKYCKAVVGVVRGATAGDSGMDQLLNIEDFRRFRPALMSFLAQVGTTSSSLFFTSFSDSLDRWMESDGDSGVADDSFELGRSPIKSADVITDECSEGYEEGPVVFYSDHEQGVKRFCQGDTLFYLGDVDLLKSRFDAYPGCAKVFQRTTLTREAYGIYFRKVADISESGFSDKDQRDAVLYAQFNNILLRKMQDSESILEYEYKQEFGDQAKGQDLMQFFKSFQYANNY